MFNDSRWRLSIPTPIKAPVLLCFLATLVAALTIITLYFDMQPVVPMFYTLTDPREYLVAKEWLFVYPALSITITFIHLIILNRLNFYNRLLMQLFAWSTVCIQALLIISLLRIVMIIT